AEPFGISEDDVRAAWTSHAYAGAIDTSMRAASAAGVTGVPAFGWAGSHAISGMMEPQRIVAMLQGAASSAPERSPTG
ncbi:MAG: DsbA family protein, partial [Candidatus Eremiobacteraeota bacterium]|nr:DsbA family protein [Candidatus Eremiobacteraeota bacterium]